MPNFNFAEVQLQFSRVALILSVEGQIGDEAFKTLIVDHAERLFARLFADGKSLAAEEF